MKLKNVFDDVDYLGLDVILSTGSDNTQTNMKCLPTNLINTQNIYDNEMYSISNRNEPKYETPKKKYKFESINGNFFVTADEIQLNSELTKNKSENYLIDNKIKNKLLKNQKSQSVYSISSINKDICLPVNDYKKKSSKKINPLDFDKFTLNLNKEMNRVSNSYGKIDSLSKFISSPLSEKRYTENNFDSYRLARIRDNSKTSKAKLEPLKVDKTKSLYHFADFIFKNKIK